MPTPSESKALIFLTGIILVGGAVRMTNAVRGAEHADRASRDALRRQIVAVESAGAVERRGKRAGPKTGNGGTGANRKGPVRTEPSSRTHGPLERAWRAEGDLGIGIVAAPPKPVPQSRSGPPGGAPAPVALVDVDRATAAELERLPRIGPALAARIVQDRTERGDYGSLQALQRVRGVGPAMTAALAPYVTFSGNPRPSIAGGAVSGASIEGGRRRRRPAPP